MRTNLKVFRVAHKLKQSEIAERIGVSRATYAFAERGERSPSQAFWDAIQREFNVSDSEMYKLMKLDEQE